MAEAFGHQTAKVESIGIPRRRRKNCTRCCFSEDESRNALEADDMYVIQPAALLVEKRKNWKQARPVARGDSAITSDNNPAVDEGPTSLAWTRR